ncbi:MAG: glycosyltransferase family 2 protein [Desulfobacterales bacterium]|nr:glycosyltransferase family 2 protein [Desulfobacterales bacterium]
MNNIASIVLCTRNRSNLLERTLRSLNNQTFNPEQYEIIVVDDCSNDNTAIVCKSLMNEIPNMKFIQSKTHTYLSSARNIGIKHSTGDVLLFTDDDCIPGKDWIEKMVLELEHSPIVAGTVACSASSYLKSCYNISQFYAYMPGKKSRRIDFIAGANMGFQRTVLDKLKGFQERRKNRIRHGNNSSRPK